MFRPSSACYDLIGGGRPSLDRLGTGSCSHDQRHKYAPRPHGGQDVGEVGLLLHAAHVGRRNREAGDVDMLEFHVFLLLL